MLELYMQTWLTFTVKRERKPGQHTVEINTVR